MERTFEILKTLGKSAEPFIRVYEKEPDKLDLEEKFIYAELEGCEGDISELRETISYLSRGIKAEGELNVRDGHYFVGEYQLRHHDDVEDIMDGSWLRAWLVRFKNEDYLDISGLSIHDKPYARVRE